MKNENQKWKSKNENQKMKNENENENENEKWKSKMENDNFLAKMPKEDSSKNIETMGGLRPRARSAHNVRM
jgi:hypothetical protein